MVTEYRPNAGIVVFNRQHQVLLCKRNDVADSWQFPQGGIEAGETASEAALRELKEETSLQNVQLIKTLETPARYTFPPHIAAAMKKRGFLNIGQDMYWSLVFFDGSDSEINLQTESAEFDDFCWTDMQTAYAKIVDFKKPAYAVAVQAFEALIADFAVETASNG